jgi:ABC-type branched-subunit amino acid transport system substrate-binding protein
MTIRALAAACVLVAVGVACENEESGGGGGDAEGRPGVTDTEIRVGGVVGETNPVGRPFEDSFVGAQAYFDRVNAEGGLFGREIVSVSERDDRSLASSNITEVRALVEEDDVFAVIPITTQVFAGADYLVEQGTPTFGWNINAEWSEGDNLFGQIGSHICFGCPALLPPWIAQQEAATGAAIFAYGQSPQSSACAEGMELGFDTYGPPAVFVDKSLAFGFTDSTAAIAGVRDSGADFVATCMDVNGTATLAQDLRDAGLDVAVYAPEGYNPAVLDDLGESVEGFYFGAPFEPFEVADPSRGMREFLAAMDEVGEAPNEHLLSGWINAVLLVDGIRAAGEDFTQQSVVDAINEMTDFTAGGILPRIDWTKAHDPDPETKACTAVLRVQDLEFVPTFGEPGKPFVCFPVDQVAESGPDTLEPTVE